jgi:bifunctional oligoribonuclease and PAP phosphatase NrnA
MLESQQKISVTSKMPLPDFAKTRRVIQQHQNFIVCTHVNPDPDALASQLAVAQVLKILGKDVRVLASDPLPKRFRFLPGSRKIQTYRPAAHIPFEVAVIVDCGDLNRIGRIQELIQPGKVILNIDHHITNELFGTLNIVIPEASSACEVLFDLFKKMHVPLTKDIATLLYLGIMTDTGSFRYENTTAHTHAVTAELMRFPIPVSEFYEVLYETIPFNEIRYFTRLVGTFDFLARGRVVCLELPRKVLAKFSDEFDLRDKIFRYLRAIKGVEVIVILSEESPTRTRVNLRSLRRVDVGRLAYRFKGGGHSRASGCILDEGMKAAKARILAEIREVL